MRAESTLLCMDLLTNRLSGIIALLLVSAIGYLRMTRDISRLDKQYGEVENFLSRVRLFLQGGPESEKVYARLIFDTPRIEFLMGSMGRSDFKPPAANYVVRNYAIISNMLPEIRKFRSEGILQRYADQYGDSVQEALIRWLGATNTSLTQLRQQRKNPFIALREGIRSIVELPLWVLHWSGLLTSAPTRSGNLLFRGLTAILYLIGVLSSFITLALGWHQFISLEWLF